MSLVTSAFLHDHAAASRHYGMPGCHSHVVVEHPVGGLDQARVAARIDAVLDALCRQLMEPLRVPSGIGGDFRARDSGTTFETSSPWEDAQRIFVERGWSDGFPVVPPTTERVEAMCRGAWRDLDDLVAILPPGLGRATVRKIAVNAVVAGCEPAHLPLILAAVEAMADERFTLATIAQSTSPSAPLFLVNGPVIGRLGLNYGTCALGPGVPSRANVVIGRALRLIMMNVGHAYPQQSDMDTIGSPNKLSLVLPENEAANPWEPFHVEQGFSPDESAVTAFPIYDLRAASDFKSGEADQLLLTYAGELGTMATGRFSNNNSPFPFHNSPLVIFPPDHARIFREAAWRKQDVRKFLFVHATVPGWRYTYHPTAFEDSRKWAPKVSPHAQVPVLDFPEQLQIAVSGGPGCIGFVCPPFGHFVSRRIEG